jgi:hypothetical protein
MLDGPSNPVESLCKTCGAQAPTKYVEFYQNIGLVVTRQWAKVDGNLCRRCIGGYFRSFTLTTLFLGWWGVISLFITPLILLNNVTRYLLSLRLPEPSLAAMDTPLSSTGLTPSVGTHSRRFKTHLWGNRLRWRSCVHRLQERRFYGKTRAAAKHRDAQCRD